MVPNEPCVTAPKNLKRVNPRLLSMFRERERRSRCINLAVSYTHLTLPTILRV